MSAVRRRALSILGALTAAALFGGLVGDPPTAPAARVSTAGVATAGSAEYVEDAHGIQVRRRYVVTGAPADRTVQAGDRIRISGDAVTARRHGRARARRVTLVERTSGRWRRVESTRTRRFGAWSVVLDAGTDLTTRTFRAELSRGRGLRGGASRSFRVRVVAGVTADPTPSAPDPGPATTPAPATGEVADPAEPLPAGYAGAGSASDWSALISGGSRWNPCEVIRWAYNPAGQGYDALADVQRAFARIAGASGLRFHYVGATSWRYLGSSDDASGFPGDTADIAVGWASAAELPVLSDMTVGYGGASGWTVPGADVRIRLRRGFLVLDNGHALPTGFDRPGWGQIELHEILHTLGLGHASGSNQLMYGTATWRNLTFGAGDLAGMTRIGAPAGCLS
ncbi:hypothetical protein [Nocardioides sp. YIM 152315]|uniref:hypothetical protein n=1 Tax=Nocardioides sp. YIM 152315 TaxID=3031760 RepID=UPI0023D9AEF7|nr:hypothetical protein [Nocardioides sp. YIM 152315]MDF1604412.1 hypothetical protein [Nocardioides sp. YIM 152315]